MSSPLLSAKCIGRRIGTRWIWCNLDFDLYPSDRLAIVGPSGVGKSILVRALAGLDPIQSGQLFYRGQPFSSLSMPHFRSQVIYLHQQPSLIEGTVEENLKRVFSFASQRHKTYRRDWVLHALSKFGRQADFLELPIRKLSGGEAQMVSCLRVLQLEPRILLLDEPTASLDEGNARTLEALIRTWHEGDPDRAWIWIDHHPEGVRRMSNRQFHLTERSQ
ncbi:MAG TPA: ATP-binding cassette domain-containing protein [Stenomitos sp.]